MQKIDLKKEEKSERAFKAAIYNGDWQLPRKSSLKGVGVASGHDVDRPLGVL